MLNAQAFVVEVLDFTFILFHWVLVVFQLLVKESSFLFVIIWTVGCIGHLFAVSISYDRTSFSIANPPFKYRDFFLTSTFANFQIGSVCFTEYQ